MKIKIPIVLACRKEMWEKEMLEHASNQLEGLGIPPQTIDYENANDRLVPYIFDINFIDQFHQSFIHLNDDEVEGVRIRFLDGYMPPIFIIRYADFEKIYQRYLKGDFEQYQDEIKDYKQLL